MKTPDRQTQEFLFPELSAAARVEALIEARAYEAHLTVKGMAAAATKKMNRKVAQRFRRIRERCQ